MKTDVSLIKDLIGCPYKIHGRTKEEGFDCYGLAVEIYRRYGFKIPDFFYDDVKPNDTSRVFNYGLPLVEKINEPQDLCLCFFKLPNNSRHIGIYLENGLMIHAIKNIGVAVTEVKKYQHFFEGYYRFKEF